MRGTTFAFAVVALLLFWLPWVGMLGIAMALVAMALGAVEIRRARRRAADIDGVVLAGIVIAVVALVLGLIVQLLVVVAFRQFVDGPGLRQMQQCIAEQRSAGTSAKRAGEYCAERYRRQLEGG